MYSKKILLMVVVGFLVQPALASQLLHLKSGKIDIQDTASFTMNDSVIYGEDTSKIENFIVQFKNKISQEDQALLEQKNIKVFGYVPDHALLVKANPEAIHELKKSERIYEISPYLARFKLDENLLQVNVFNSSNQEEILIRTFLATDLNIIVNQLKEIGAQVLSAEGKTILARLNRSQVYQAAQLNNIEFIQPYYQMKLQHMAFDNEVSSEVSTATGDYKDVTGFETGTKIMGFEESWARGFNGQGQVVSMADTGLDSGDTTNIHQDFGHVSMGFAFGMFTKTWRDPMGHGTHVAGSVMSAGAASGGVFRGGAYGATMVAEGMWSDMLNNLTVPPQLSKLFNSAYENGARVHTNSWGSPQNLGAYDGMAVQVDEYMWEHPDMLILFAAGNSGEDVDKNGRVDEGSVSSPGTAKNALTVGASENYLMVGGIQRKIGDLKGGAWKTEPLGSDFLSNNENGIAVFSSRGPAKDGRIKPDVVAPGTNILSVCSQVEGASPLWGNYNKDYCYSGGTSMSTPLVAGAAAVARQYAMQELGLQNPSAAVVKAMLMNTAKDLYPGQFGQVGKSAGQELLTPGPNINQGFGRVDMAKLTEGSLIVFDEAVGVKSGEEKTFKVNVPAQSSVRITLVYTDAPGVASAAKALVNDLSLMVVNGTSIEGRNDTLNNAEQIVTTAKSTELQIKVKGERVVKGKNGHQAFAIAVSL